VVLERSRTGRHTFAELRFEFREQRAGKRLTGAVKICGMIHGERRSE